MLPFQTVPVVELRALYLLARQVREIVGESGVTVVVSLTVLFV